MKILTSWLRALLPELTVTDAQLGEDLTLRGIAVEGIHSLGAGNGSLFEMDITTNRVDAMNHYGVAREAATIYGLTLAPGSAPLPAARPAAAPFPVRIQAEDACGRFTARVLREIRIAPTASVNGPLSGFAARIFALLEQKPISNAVDATNFAWLAMGQPTHAFDLDKIEGGIVVRRARQGETLKTLDGVERTLDPEDLIVADHARPLALAGVMGGWETMITPETTNVLVEAAWFDPVAVRRTARRHGLHTDASHRFERGADFAAAPLASAIVSALLLENGGYCEGELVDLQVAAIAARTAHRPPVALALAQVHRLLGQTLDAEGITAATVETVLGGLGCVLQPHPETGESSPGKSGPGACWQVTLPSWRLDLEREIDLIEEIARVHGYNRFANTLPAFSGAVAALPAAESLLRFTLRAAGVHEAIGSTFCSAADAALTEPQPRAAVPLENPLSAEAGLLRPSLVPSMLAMLGGNLHRDIADVRLFELGTVFTDSTPRAAGTGRAADRGMERVIERVDESLSLAIGLAGSVAEDGLVTAQPLDFFHLKGIVEQLVACFATQSVLFDTFPPEAALTPAWLHPWRSARLSVNGLTIGWLGELHPREAAARKFRSRVLVAELAVDRLFALPLRRPALRDLSQFQPVRRDFSLLVPDRLAWADLDRALAAQAIPEMLDWRLREVLASGPGIPDGHQALLVSITFQAADRTLRDDELQAFTAAMLAALDGLGIRLRASTGQ